MTTLHDLMLMGKLIPAEFHREVNVLYLVGPLPPDTAPGDKLAVTVHTDGDGSLVVELDTALRAKLGT